MTYWEFLLQQDGDRTWLPLETAHVEILEGRYRIVAHTSHSDTPVDIHLTQRLAEQIPPKRRVLKRQGRTNDDGLMVVLPFTHLTAGTWTLRCCAADPSGDHVDPFDYGVQLRVVPVEDDPDNWLPDWDMPEDEPLPTSLQALSNPLAEPLAAGRQTPRPSSVPGARATPPPAPTQATVGLLQVSDDFPEIEVQPLGALPLRLRLDQQALMAQPQQPITLVGEVIAMGEAPVLPGAGSLGLQLRDPDQGKVVARLSRSLSWTTLPAAFAITIPVPDVSGTRLLVGEMSLWLGTVDAPQVMAIQGFTVTTNLDSLLDAVTQRGEAGLTFQEDALETGIADPVGSESAASAEAQQLGQETVKTAPLAMPTVREVPFRLIYLPASGLTLPPQIQSVAPGDRLPRSLALPTLPNQPVRPAPKAPQGPQKALELPLVAPRDAGHQSQVGASAALGAHQGAEPEPERTLQLPFLGKPISGQATQEQEPSSLDTPPGIRQDAEAIDEPIAQVPSLVPDAEFTALNLKDRFWGRLTALAQDGHSAAAGLKREMAAAGVEADLNQEGAPSLDLPTVEPLPTVAVTAPSHEVVIYDEPEPSLDGSTEGLGTADPSSSSNPETPDELETLVVPVPHIELSEATLVAGKPLSLTVSLPPFPHRLAVKFWMTDIQNRSLLEKPRWLMNWTPSVEGQLEALLQLQVPMGCLEVRFEAIAVDLATQEESHKMTLQRPITASQETITAPEDLP
ncbi:MAG: hypothetical protein O3A14_13605 [Cyanobacteria bacterium]|nr:hypothetical protein [Cyanobacteriota bacterium]